MLQNLQNEKLFKNNFIFNDCQKFNDEQQFQNLDYLNKIYNSVNNAKIKVKPKEEIPKFRTMNEMTIKYKNNKSGINKYIKLFDSVFIKNNRDKLQLLIDNKEQKKLLEFYYNYTDKEEITIKLKEKQPITNMSYMFNNCKNLYSIDSTKWDTINITNMEALFQLSSIGEITNISNWNISNVINISKMFSKCINLKSIPDMRKWGYFKC